MTNDDKKYFERNYVEQTLFEMIVSLCVLFLIIFGFNQVYKDLIRIESKIEKIDSHIEEYVDSTEIYKKEINYNLNYE